MAQIIIHRSWSEGDCLTVDISVDDSFPDACAEAVGTALRAYREALEVTVGADEDDE